MAEVNPKAYPLADAQLTITILDIVQQAAVRATRTNPRARPESSPVTLIAHGGRSRLFLAA
jgi:hypothetical protein